MGKKQMRWQPHKADIHDIRFETLIFCNFRMRAVFMKRLQV